MGQAKSKAWRRLSESDVHLLSDECPIEATTVGNRRSLEHARPLSFDDQIVDYSGDHEPAQNACKLLRVAKLAKTSQPRASRSSLACPSSVVLRSAAHSAQLPPSYDETLANSVPDSLRRSLQTQSTIFPASSAMLCKSELPLTPEEIYSCDTNHSIQPLIDFEANDFVVKNHEQRPMSMFQLEANKGLSPLMAGVHRHPHRHSQMPVLSPPPPTINDRRHRLSLNEMLEGFNSFEECADFSDHSSPEASNNNDKSNLSLNLSSETEAEVKDGEANRKEIRAKCSSLECQCPRCFANRYKLLNWLLPNCTRMNAERLLYLRKEGTFLVRKSEKFPGQYTLSFVCRRVVRHCLIMRSVYGFGLRWPYSFETLQQVIAHYARTSLLEFNAKLDVRLRYPVFSS